MKIFESIQGSVYTKEVSVEYCLQPRLKSPRVKESYIDSYWNDYIEKGFDFVIKNYADNSVTAKKQILSFLRRACGKALRIIKLRK